MSESVAFLLSDASRLFRRAFNAQARAHGVTGPQWRLLAILARRPGLNQGTAADLLEVEPITLSRMVDRLEAQGLTERRPDPTDRRAWRLYITDAAQTVLQDIRGISDSIADTALHGFSSEEREAYMRMTARFRDNLSGKDDDND
jgi:DNA-binding MarR family transcriptional regulator